MNSFEDAMKKLSMEKVSEHKKIDLVLMNKDREIMQFSYHEEDMSDWFEEEMPTGILPVGYTDIQSWLHHRKSPYGRKNMQLLMAYSQCDSLIGYTVLTKCVSLNDTFWVRLKGEDISWEDVSPYTNTLDDVVASYAFEGTSEIEIGSPSPEYSTDGTFPKCWINNEGVIQLVKGGTKQNDFCEPWSEYYASDICRFLHENTVEYFYENYKNQNVSICNLFTTEEIGFSSFSKIFKKNLKQDEIFREFKRYGQEDLFRAMIVSDALTLNVDRHLGNIGFLINNDSQQIKSIAPIFDFNMSYIPSLINEVSNKELIRVSESLTPRLGVNFIGMAKFYLDDKLRSRLIQLYDVININHITWRYDMIAFLTKRQILRILEKDVSSLRFD